MSVINKEMNKYVNIKPKYFNRKEINDLNNFLKNIEYNINELELIKNNCRCNLLINENNLLKMKLKTIKNNLENVEIKVDINNNYIKKELEIKDIIVFLEDSKVHKDIFFKFIINILLILLNYLSYVYIFYNNIIKTNFNIRSKNII
jgi:hypothetical protein